MDWIPVTERLPEKDGRYLCTIQNKYAPEVVGVMVCDYWNFVSMHDWCPDDQVASDNVIAWMPLPAPYVEPTDEPSASELRGEMYWADQGDEE